MRITPSVTGTIRRRPARRFITLLGAFGVVATLAPSSHAALPTAAQALSVVPWQDKTVDIDRPDAEATQRCTVAQERFEGAPAIVVRGPGGVILRAFPDTNGDNVVDQWIFFKGGTEVYRELDTDYDSKADADRRPAPGAPSSAGPRVHSQTRRPSVRR